MIIRIFFATLLCVVGIGLLALGGFCGWFFLQASTDIDYILFLVCTWFFALVFFLGAFFILKSSKRHVADDQKPSVDKKIDKRTKSNTLRLFFTIILAVCSFWFFVLGGFCLLLVSPINETLSFSLYVIIPLALSSIFLLSAIRVSRSSNKQSDNDFYDSIKKKNLHIIDNDDDNTSVG